MKTYDQTALKLNIWMRSITHFAWFTYGVPKFRAHIDKTVRKYRGKP